MMVYALLEYDFDDAYLINVYSELSKAQEDKELFEESNAARGYNYLIQERTLIQCK